jgi:hypothetical protein
VEEVTGARLGDEVDDMATRPRDDRQVLEWELQSRFAGL